MKKTFFCVCLIVTVLGKNIQANDLIVFLGATYNPMNPDYIMGSLVLDMFSGDYDDKGTFIAETRISYGSLTYRYDASNPFTVQQETTELWAKGGVFETTVNGIYQYILNDTVGLRFGFGLPFLWSGVFAGEKPGLTGKGSNTLAATIGFYGILGVIIFPTKRFPIVVTASPGVMLDPYFKDNPFPFTLPFSIVVGWNRLINN